MKKSKVRISSVSQLPIEDLCWVYDLVSEQRTSQVEILNEINACLHAVHLPKVSRSAFNRWALKVRAGSIQCPRPLEDKASADLPSKMQFSKFDNLVVSMLISLLLISNALTLFFVISVWSNQ